MKIYKFLKNNKGSFEAFILKEINMGEVNSSDILEFVDEKYLRIEQGEVFIKEGLNVGIRHISNGCLEILFEDIASSCDIAFDEDEDYDKYFKIY